MFLVAAPWFASALTFAIIYGCKETEEEEK